MLDTEIKLKDKNFETGILWQTNQTTLPMNRDLPERSLYSLEGKLEKNPVLERKYSDYEVGYSKWLSWNNDSTGVSEYINNY